MRHTLRLGWFAKTLRIGLSMTLTWAVAAGSLQPAVGESPTNDAKWVGEPQAAGMLMLLEKEIASGLQKRRIDSSFARFRSYAAMKLDATAGPRRASEVTGNCRLAWYDHLLRNPEKAPAEAEQFTRQLHEALLGDHQGLDRALAIGRAKMDLGRRETRKFAPVGSPDEALAMVKRALTEAQLGHSRALSPLTRTELGELTRNLYPVLVSQNRLGHRLANASTGRRLCNLMEKMDRAGIYDAADALAPLSSPELLAQLASLPADDQLALEGITGAVAQQIVTPSGTIVIGGRGDNVYQLDKLLWVNVVIDLGGNDVYYEGAVSIRRPVLVTIDLEGDDTYEATKPGVQGSAVMGISMLLDVAGDDLYRAQDMAQASCLAGAGILVDYAGNDTYIGRRRVQGQAVGGVGILVDRAGEDRYHGALWTQGMGGPLGFAVLDDLDGNDHYYTGGLYLDDYEETPGYDGWGQGVGAGPRGVASGGIGVILDGGGDDVYEFDYLAHGGGYWQGLGFARDFAGNDQRLGPTRTSYSGGTRTQSRYQRFGIGFGCHYALGFCFDDQGNDFYYGTIMGLGHAWDCSVGALCDFGGNDRYESRGVTTQGNASQAGLGILFDYDGDDVHRGRGQGYASPSITYHDMPRCGGNFSFVVDYGGQDSYGYSFKNNSYNRRGTGSGFLIDRPKRESETGETAEPAAVETAATQ